MRLFINPKGQIPEHSFPPRKARQTAGLFFSVITPAFHVYEKKAQLPLFIYVFYYVDFVGGS